MKKENIKRKKKIATYLLLMLLLITAFALISVRDILKNANELIALGDPMIIKFYTNIFVLFIILTAIVVTAIVLFVIALSINRK